VHGSETWPVRKENDVAWMCDVSLKDRVPSKELRERLGLYDIISVCTARQVVMVWACVAKRRKQLLGEKMYGV